MYTFIYVFMEAFFADPNNALFLIITLVGISAYLLIKEYKPEWLKSKTTGGATPLLDSYTTDFTAIMASKEPDPVIGRDHEILRLAQILSRRNKNNAILVGPPGVGKTAIVEGLAQRIVQQQVPSTLLNKRVLSLDITALVSGTKYRGEFEKRAKQLVQEIRGANRSIVLFIDEIHSVIQSQGSEGSINFSDILKPALARGDLQMVGATTIAEYHQYITKDPALERRFQPVYVDEPTEEQAISILQGLKDKYAHYHKVTFTEAALRAAVTITHKKITGRTLPDKAIDAIDEAASLVRVSHLTDAVHIILYQAALKKDPAIATVWEDIQSIDKKILAAKNEKTRKHLVAQREGKEKDMEKAGVLIVDVDDVQHVVKQWITTQKSNK